MTEPGFLKVSHLSAGYGDVNVLWDVSLAVGRGQIVCLVGSNGAGKTTLLRVISGIVSPSKGSVLLEGCELAGAGTETILRAGIAHVPEGRRLFAPMSVQDNLLIGAYVRPKSATAEVKADLEKMFSLFPILADRRFQPAGTLSGGEQQMCAIARGMMSRPRLLMIDELSLGLAPQIVEKLCEVLRQIVATGVSVLVVEQDVMTAFDLAEEAVVLDTGRVSKTGLTADLRDDQAIRDAYMGLVDSSNE